MSVTIPGQPRPRRVSHRLPPGRPSLLKPTVPFRVEELGSLLDPGAILGRPFVAGRGPRSHGPLLVIVGAGAVAQPTLGKDVFHGVAFSEDEAQAKANWFVARRVRAQARKAKSRERKDTVSHDN